jgi:large subunit ribosomal protein L20
MHGLKLAEVQVNRKMLADLAVREKGVFAAIVAKASEALAA